MKYVILIHSNPDPWGHPTIAYTDEGRATSDEHVEQMTQRFEALLEEMSASGELVTGVALAAPQTATVLRWQGDGAVATDGPYAEAKEHLAGLFIVDCETRERAEEVVTAFASPGDVVELRPAMFEGGDDG